MKNLFYLLVILSFTQCLSQTTENNVSIVNSELHPIYKKYCQGCHGDRLQKFQDSNWQNKSNTAQISEIIRNGQLELGMPAFGTALSDSEINVLTEFILDYDYSSNPVPSASRLEEKFAIEVVVDGLGIPWGMAFLEDGKLLISERSGALKLFDNGNITEIKGLPAIRAKGQGGLLDLKLHPEYQRNGWIYISYSYIDEQDKSKGNTAIIRARLDGDTLVDVQEIYKAVPAVRTGHHYGCRMVLDKEGYLWFSNGDRGRRDEFPQNLDNSNGKIHRLHDDGSIPKDNPFVDNDSAIHSIYSYGHRNPQGIIVHPETGEIWAHEHGPKGGDEINLIMKGANYGWPVISYGINYNGTKFTKLTEKEGMMQPLHCYVPSIAPCGMTYVTSDLYPEWKGSLLIGSLSFRYLERIRFDNYIPVEQERLLEGLDSRVRDVRQGPDGYIYVALENPGRIVKLLPNSSQ